MVSKAAAGCLACVRWAPVLFIAAVILWSYYAYVVEMCVFTVTSIPEKVIYLLLYHPILAMFAWAYWQTIFTKPVCIPREFYLTPAQVAQLESVQGDAAQRDLLLEAGRDLPVQCRTVELGLRYCDRCKAIKPDRAHHCSVCGQCVLKMDHHCPWVNNCVCFSNYKYFVLFLGYGLVYCVFVCATSTQYFILFWEGIRSAERNNLHILFLFFASIMFALSLLFLFGYHIMLTTKNRSTLESFRAPIFQTGPNKDGFNLGSGANFRYVFGERRARWMLPLPSNAGDGVTYPLRAQQQTAPTYQALESGEYRPKDDARLVEGPSPQ